jgi:hypothetical protein
MSMVSVNRSFLRAEQTGNWYLHLQSAYEILPYLAAAGHNYYTKSLHLYIFKKCLNLKEKHPDVVQQSGKGKHVIERTNHDFAAVSSDHAIEQNLMASFKSRS